MGPDADCDFCSLVHWTSGGGANSTSSTSSTSSSHLRVITYGETDMAHMMQQQQDICTAREHGQPPPTAADPVLRQFAADPNKARSMVLKFDALKLYVRAAQASNPNPNPNPDHNPNPKPNPNPNPNQVQLKRRLAHWTIPCMFSEVCHNTGLEPRASKSPGRSSSSATHTFAPRLGQAFAGRFAQAREARRLVPTRPSEEVWMAIHLRWGDVGASGASMARYAEKTVPLAALTEQTLKVKALLGGANLTKGRRLVVHFFSEIAEAQVAGFVKAVPEARLHTSASVAETFDLWSQCEARYLFITPRG